MAIRKVAVMGHPILREVAKPVPEKAIGTPEFKAFLSDMFDTMIEYDGRGLAAPQVFESLQVVVMIWDFDPDKKPGVIYLINPTVEILSEETSTFWEGCLSVPGLRGKVARPNRVRVRALNEKKEKLDFEAEGFAATVIQHECDHLLGKLYVDKLTDPTQLAFNREYAKYIAPLEDGSGEDADNE